MLFAKRVFLLAGVMGIILVAPAYFMEPWSEKIDPPHFNHPEHYYGMIGVVLVFQFLYLIIATDPVRYRPLMLLGALGKGTFAVSVFVLFAAGRVAPLWLGLATFDSTWVVLFLIAYARLPQAVLGAGEPGSTDRRHSDEMVRAS
jgi:hypothetical protein